jgi:hypothetical protein
MVEVEIHKRVCSSCGWQGRADEVLRTENPFSRGRAITGCPLCKDIDVCETAVCDEPGCWRIVSCGTSTPNGYRSTCRKHKPKED